MTGAVAEHRQSLQDSRWRCQDDAHKWRNGVRPIGLRILSMAYLDADGSLVINLPAYPGTEVCPSLDKTSQESYNTCSCAATANRGIQLDDVEHEEQHHPDNINKVPVHLNCRDSKVPVFGEIATQRAKETDQQKQHASSHVCAMEPGQREEG